MSENFSIFSFKYNFLGRSLNLKRRTKMRGNVHITKITGPTRNEIPEKTASARAIDSEFFMLVIFFDIVFILTTGFIFIFKA